MTPTIYRAMLVASLALGILSGIFDFIVPSTLPEVFKEAQESYDAAQATDEVLLFLLPGVVCVVVSLAAFVGLFLFRSWAPRLAVISTLLGMLVTVLMGPGCLSGWAIMLSDLAGMLWGAVVILPYVFPPLQERFAKLPG